ncbi:MAG: ATP-binding protein [Magnetococcales bacterium]|nr:ATP-binding protein [Magnetococcales bacterium]
MSTTMRIKDRDAVINALRAGVVPRTGQHLIQVGRKREVEALLRDIERIHDGGSSFRIVIGEYGSGKTFFLNLIRSFALEKRLVTMQADLNPDRRLHASGGQTRSLYQELTRNLATRTKPEGNALQGVIEKFIAQARTDAKGEGTSAEGLIRGRLLPLTELVNGYDFAEVIAAYCRGYDTNDTTLQSQALRWLRGEFSTRTDARNALGVRTIVDDATVYDQIKLMGRFVRLAGFSGLLVCLDELVNLYKLANTQARNGNYEQILRILNDSLQGYAEGVGFLLGGTPEFLLDTRRGLYSYEALQSRLAENRFVKNGLVDLSGPIIRLTSLTPEELFVLLGNLRHVYASGHPERYLLPDEGLQAFLDHCARRLGDAYFRTPRSTIRAFIDLLATLEQNPGVAWSSLLDTVELAPDLGGEIDQPGGDDDELVSFRL